MIAGIKKLTSLLICGILLLSGPKDPGTSNSPFFAEFHPQETGEALANPYMGWAPWASGGPYSIPHSLVYINASWRELEPQKGVYRFDLLEKENKFDYWASKNVKIILRINMDYPGSSSHLDIPDWLYNETGKDGTWYDISYGKGYSPNYSNKTLIGYHKLLITALAKRYNPNAQIAFIAVGSLGHWGEFHTWKSDSYVIPFPGTNITDQYIKHYLDNFTEKPLLMRRPFTIAKINNIGLFNDSFGDERQTVSYFLDYIGKGYNDYLTGETQPAMSDFWKYAPSGGEFADYPGTRYMTDSRIARTLEMAKESHLSWLGPSAPIYGGYSGEINRNTDLLLKTMGYRFIPLYMGIKADTFSSDNTFTLQMAWINRGTAPFYFDWPMELRVTDENGRLLAKKTIQTNIRSWLPGIEKRLPDIKLAMPELSDGAYSFSVGFLNPATGHAEIKLPIRATVSGGFYQLGKLYIQDGKPSVSP